MICIRGDIVTVLFPFSSGTGAKHRPALVVQNDVNNRRMTNVIVAAITTTKHRSGQPTQLLVEFASPVGKQSGLAHDSVVTCEAAKKGQVSFLGLPLGRVVVSRPRRTALLLVHWSSPNGTPRWTLRRSEFNSASVSALFTQERQFRGNGGSSGIASQRSLSAGWRRT